MTAIQQWLIAAAVLAGGVVIYALAPVLAPFLTGALLAYLGDPLVGRLVRLGLPRTLAVVAVFIVIFAFLLAIPLWLVPLVENQIAVFARNLPTYLQWVQDVLLPWATGHLGSPAIDLSNIKDLLVQQWQQAGGLAVRVVKVIGASGGALLAWLANLVLVPVVTFYLLRDWQRVLAALRALLPRAQAPLIESVARECDEMLATFLRGQLTVMLALGVMYSFGLWLVGLDLAFLIGLIAGLVSFVPYLGLIVGMAAAGVAALMQFHEVLPLVYVALVFGIAQLIEGTVLTPLLVGDRIGLHPVAVIFAVMAGGQLFGFVGVLLALPAAAVIAVIVRRIYARYKGEDGSAADAAKPETWVETNGDGC